MKIIVTFAIENIPECFSFHLNLIAKLPYINMKDMKKTIAKPAEGKLGIMVVGCGAVATTFMTGVLMTRKGLAKPIGSMTQYDKIRVGRGAEKQYLHYKDIVPLAKLDDIVFGT